MRIPRKATTVTVHFGWTSVPLVAGSIDEARRRLGGDGLTRGVIGIEYYAPQKDGETTTYIHPGDDGQTVATAASWRTFISAETVGGGRYQLDRLEHVLGIVRAQQTYNQLGSPADKREWIAQNPDLARQICL